MLILEEILAFSVIFHMFVCLFNRNLHDFHNKIELALGYWRQLIFKWSPRAIVEKKSWVTLNVLMLIMYAEDVAQYIILTVVS